MINRSEIQLQPLPMEQDLQNFSVEYTGVNPLNEGHSTGGKSIKANHHLNTSVRS